MFKIGTLPLSAIVTRFLSSVPFSLCLTFLGITLAAAQINTLPRISITPLNPSVSSGGKLQFTALVVNTSDTGVRWWASAGTISRDVLFLAPEVTSQQFVRVTAASVVGLAVRASVEVAVIPAQPLRITTSRLAAAKLDSSSTPHLSPPCA